MFGAVYNSAGNGNECIAYYKVMQTFVENLHSISRKTTMAHNVNAMSIHILVHEEWQLFKVKITHELTEDD